MDQIALWLSAADAFDERYRRLDGRDGLPTPCDEFTVADLISHVVDVQIRFARLLGATVEPDASWVTVRAAMTHALTDPSVLHGHIDHPSLGQTDCTRLLAIATTDLLIHASDLAQALGLDDTLPSGNLEPAIEGIEAFPPEVRAALFRPPVPVEPGASPQQRLLALAGRRR